MITLRTLKAGDQVSMSTRRMRPIDCIFLGFSDDREKYGEPGPAFASFAALQKAKGYASFAAMDAAQEGKEYGFGIYAWFQEADADGKITTFTAYRYEGGWAVGSGAERISLGARS